MNLSQIKKVRVYEQVIEQIKHSVEQGQIRAGECLPSERELAVKLGISRSVVREAMSVLNASGVIEVRQGIGVFLVDDEEQLLLQRMNRALRRDSVNVLELLEVRQGLEGQAAFLAAQKSTEKDLVKMQEALERMEQAVLGGMLAANEDFAFHNAVVKASKNETIIEMVRLLSDRFLTGLNESRSRSMKLPDKSERVMKEHFAIFEAIQSRDAEQARKLMLQHLENVKTTYQQLKEEGQENVIQS